VFRILPQILVLICPLQLFAERINHEGRILGPLAVITNSILFNTTNADAIISTMQIFPVTHAWNEDISRRPLLSNSDAMVSQVIADLTSSPKSLRAFQEMNFVLVPDSQPLAPISFDLPPEYYPDDSDPGPYPIPSNMPIEMWPTGTGNLTLQQWQQDTTNLGGDRHAIIVQPGTGLLWEMWRAKLTNSTWHGGSGAKWDMKTNSLRPLYATSADAAGLPMFGGLVRFDECERGMVEHACRLVVGKTRAQFIYPATHRTGSDTNLNRPAMGERFRLKSSFVISNSFTLQEKAILSGLKKYGALVSDNGSFFSISIVPDDRWPAGAFNHVSSIGITNFEVIQTTGETEGPRSPGAPAAFAGADQFVALGQPASLLGVVTATNAPTTNQWKLYSGPGAVAFGDASQTNTSATFTAPGVYTLLFSADDRIHAVAYDAVVVTVTQAISVAISRATTNVSLSWTGGAPPYVVESAGVLSSNAWSTLLMTNGRSATLPLAVTNDFFRVRGQPF